MDISVAFRITLYHISYSNWCFTVLFPKNNKAIDINCTLPVTKTISSQAIYLDQSTWVVSAIEIDQKKSDVMHVCMS